jgi:uncharacterized lipoprotein YbaY
VVGYATFRLREPLPPGAELKVSLLRERNDALEQAIGSFTFPAGNPPVEFHAEFPVERTVEDDRFFLDVRVVANGQTLFRNRAALRVPVRGWTTKREVALDVERS